MKKLFTISCILYFFNAGATNYYFSANGDDGNKGTSPSTPWKTLSKFNSVFASINPGDSILFNRGDFFYGELIISRSGKFGSSIVIGSYGLGVEPIITGFTSIQNWARDDGGIYEYSCPQCQTSLNMITFQDTLQPMGRWPKLSAFHSSYLTINSHTGATSLTSAELAGALNYIGGEVVSRKNDWILDRARILTQSGTTITCLTFPYPLNGKAPYNFKDNNGFFIQNHVNTLTQLGEWAYDSVSKKIKMYFGSKSPSSYTVQASTIDYLVTINGFGWITFDHITFKGSNSRTFSFGSPANHIQINNCIIKFSGMDAIAVSGTSNNIITLNKDTITYTNNNGISGNGSSQWTITNNTFLNTGMVSGAGASGDGQYEGMAYIKNKSLIQFNVIKNTGYIAIEFYGDSMTVKNNFVDSFDRVKRDGGAIYTYAETNKFGRKVIGNIVLHGIGDNYGVGANLADPHDKHALGIYLDGGARNLVIDSNTVAYCDDGGFHSNNSQNISMKGNTFFSNGVYQMNFTDINMSPSIPVSGLMVKNNILFAKDSDQLILSMVLTSNYNAGTIDSNYYCRPIFEPSNIDIASYHTYQNGGGIVQTYPGWRVKSLDQWQIYSSQDVHTHKSPKAITNSASLRFYYNPTSMQVTYPIKGLNFDVKGISFQNSIVLEPYSSAILFQQ
jgi:parallel beta-helix repeat protein